MSYDKSMEKLDEIISKLSDEKLGLEESLKLYADGIIFAKEALHTLDEFKEQIRILNNDLSQFDIPVEDLPDNDKVVDNELTDETGDK